MRRSGYNVFAWFNFPFRKAQIKVWMIVVVAGGVFSSGYTKHILVRFLCAVADDITFALLCNCLTDISFFCF